MVTEMSACCNAPVYDSVYYWICSKCKKACDLIGQPSFPSASLDEGKLREKIANIICSGHSHPSCSPCSASQAKAEIILSLIQQSLPELAKKAGYVKLAKGDKVICKMAWDLLSPVIKAGIEAREGNFRKIER